MSIDWRYPPRAHDPSLRLRHYGRVQPMLDERGATARQRLAVAAAILAPVLVGLLVVQVL